VVGGGLTGLSAAFHAKERNSNWKVVLIEAAQIAAGSSGMAGGIIVKDKSVPNSEKDAEFFYSFMDRLHLGGDLLSSEGRLSGVANEYANDLLNPLCLARKFAAVCVQIGVELHEASAASGIEAHQSDIVVTGQRFLVRSRCVVLAIDAYADMWNGLFGSDFSTSSQVCVVAQLKGPGVSKIPWVYYRSIGGGADEFVWGRRIGAGRFLFGSKEGPRDQFKSYSRRAVIHDLRVNLPDFRDAVTESVWSGLISRFRDAGGRVRPVLDGRILFGGGYNGYGITASVATGAEIANTISFGTYSS
jgi:glycine/D-amino acid oxidase-like deaminating enzyme